MSDNSPATGTIVAIHGQVAKVRFVEQRPARHDVLQVADRREIQLEVISSVSPNVFFCFILNPDHRLSRGVTVENTGASLAIPAGEKVLGRAFDIFGAPHDLGGPLEPEVMRPMFGSRNRSLEEIKNPEEVIETGIKAIDFFTPIMKAGKTALVGGAGVGKTVVLTAIMRRLMIQNPIESNSVAVFGAVGERSREAQELYDELKEAEALPYTSLILGQMGENPALRFRTAYAAATLAEYFRDEMKKNVLYFMDNVYRFAQAGHELSTLMGDIPSEDGYQPTLASQVADLSERLISKEAASITSFWAVFVPSDDLTDQGVRSVFPYLDSMVILSRDVVQAGRYPAVDLLHSISSALNPLTLGQEHYKTYIEAKQVLEVAHDLERIVSLVGESELSQENQMVYRRAQLIQNFMTQDLFVGSSLSSNTKKYISRAETVQSVGQILKGEFDQVPPDELLYIGGLDEVKQKEKVTTQKKS